MSVQTGIAKLAFHRKEFPVSTGSGVPLHTLQDPALFAPALVLHMLLPTVIFVAAIPKLEETTHIFSYFFHRHFLVGLELVVVSGGG